MAGHSKHGAAKRPRTVRMELSPELWKKLGEVAGYFHTNPSTALYAAINALHTAALGASPCDGKAYPARRRVGRVVSAPTPVADILKTLLPR